MKFELEEYHRNISDRELIGDLRKKRLTTKNNSNNNNK